MSRNIKGITVEIGGNTAPLDKALQGVNKTSRDLQSELRQVERLLKLDPTNTELLAQKQKLLASSIENTENKLKTLKAAEKQAQEQFEEGKISEQQYRALQQEIIKTEQELKKLETQAGKTKLNLEHIGKTMQDTGKQVSDVGGSMSKTITAPLLGVGAAATKIGMDFEQSMSKVRAMSGASSEEMQKLEKAARDAGASTSKSAKDAADALSYMALAGWDTTTSMDGLMPVLRLSEAGNIDLARASSLVTDSMSAMGIQVEDLPRYLDIVAQTARSSNTDIDQMAEAYLGVGGTLRGLKVPLDDSALALGFLANAGIKGSEAGTSLNAIFTNLTAPTGRAKEALNNLSFTAFDAEGNFKGVENVLVELQDKMAGMTDEQRNMTLSMIGGKEHVKGLNALINGLDDSYLGLKQSISEADGALEEVATTMQENNKGSLIELASALEEVALKIYDILKPTIGEIISSIQKFIDKLNSLSPAQQEMIVKFAMVAAAIGPVILIVGKLITAVGAIVSGFSAASGAIKAAGGAAGIATKAISLMTGPIGITIALIASLIAIGILLYKNWDSIKEYCSSAWESIKQATSDATEKIKAIFSSVIDFMKNNWAAILLFIVNPFLGAFKLLYDNCAAFRIYIDNFVAGIIAFFTETIPAFVETIIGWFRALPGAMIDIGKNIVTGIWDGIQAMASWLWDKVTGFTRGIVDGIKGALKIKSPSQVFADEVGKFMAQGIAVGFEGEMNSVSNNMAKAIPVPRLENQAGIGNTSISSGYNQTVNIYSPNPLNPSEVARQTRNASRQLVLGVR